MLMPPTCGEAIFTILRLRPWPMDDGVDSGLRVFGLVSQSGDMMTMGDTFVAYSARHHCKRLSGRCSQGYHM